MTARRDSPALAAGLRSLRSLRPAAKAEGETPGRTGEARCLSPLNVCNFQLPKVRNFRLPLTPTDPDARLCRKGKGQSARLCHTGHALVENCSGMVVGASVTEATGTAEREAGLELLGELPKRAERRTVGCDKGYDKKAFVERCRDLSVTPHAAAKRSGGAWA